MILEFPNKKEDRKAEERRKRIEEADERVNKGEATDEDIDLYIEEFLGIIECLEEGKLEFIEPDQTSQ